MTGTEVGTVDTADVLGEALAARLRYLSLSHHDAARESQKHDPQGKGLSPRTITAVVSGERSQLHPRTAGLIEKTVNWPRGTVQHVLDGGAPPDEGITDPSVQSRVEELERQVSQLRRMLAAMLEDDGVG